MIQTFALPCKHIQSFWQQIQGRLHPGIELDTSVVLVTNTPYHVLISLISFKLWHCKLDFLLGKSIFRYLICYKRKPNIFTNDSECKYEFHICNRHWSLAGVLSFIETRETTLVLRSTKGDNLTIFFFRHNCMTQRQQGEEVLTVCIALFEIMRQCLVVEVEHRLSVGVPREINSLAILKYKSTKLQ